MQENKVLSEKIRSLLKLHDIRIKRLEKVFREKRERYEEAKDVVEQREASIARLKLSRSNGFNFLAQDDVINKPASHMLANTHRYWVDYDLEKDEYYLDSEKQEMAEAELIMNRARKDWFISRARKDEMQKQLVKQKKMMNQIDEKKQEMEIEEAALSGRELICQI